MGRMRLRRCASAGRWDRGGWRGIAAIGEGIRFQGIGAPLFYKSSQETFGHWGDLGQD